MKGAVFTDPNCSACQALERNLEQVDDVTIYVFMTPVIRPEKNYQSKSVWCSADRVNAWRELTTLRRLPAASPNCPNPIEANLAMSQALGIRATPTLVFEDGQRAQGSLPTGVLRERLARAEQHQLAQAR